jgi:hypothetical protein
MFVENPGWKPKKRMDRLTPYMQSSYPGGSQHNHSLFCGIAKKVEQRGFATTCFSGDKKVVVFLFQLVKDALKFVA